MNQLTRAICLTALLCSASIANAVSVVQQLSNVTFDDGALATGYVVFDAESAQITNFDIVTTAGRNIAEPFEYRPDTARIGGQSNDSGAGWPFSFLQLLSLPSVTPSGGRELMLDFSAPLALGRPVAILYEDSLGKRSFERRTLGQHSQQLRLVTGPQIIQSTVPEPSVLFYVAVGLGLMWQTRILRKVRMR